MCAIYRPPSPLSFFLSSATIYGMYLGGSFTVRVPDQRAQTGTNGKGRERRKREKGKERDEIGEKRDGENSKGGSKRYGERLFSAVVEVIIRYSPSEHFTLDLLSRELEE